MLWDLRRAAANVVVNDLGQNGGFNNAMRVVEEIRAAGGTAIGDTADVADFAEVSEMVARAERLWGRVDILVNNAGVLRDKTFAKMEMADFEFVLRVHLIGLGQLHEGRLGGHAGAQLRAHRAHVLGFRDLRKFWPGELRRRKSGHDRAHERAAS